MGRVMSDRALRNYAFRVVKSELGEHEEDGIIIPAKMSDEQIASFVSELPREKLDEIYGMMYGSEMVE